MAISFTTSNYSTDFIPSGSPRVESKGSAGGSQFAEMLGSQSSKGSNGSGGLIGGSGAGSVGSSGSLQSGDKSLESIKADSAVSGGNETLKDIAQAVKDFAEGEEFDVSEMEKVGDVYVVGIEEKKEVSIPESDKELAEAIVNGDIKLEDVPEERLTFALLKAIIAAKFKKKLEDDRKAVDPKEKGNDQSNPSELVDARLAVLYRLIDAYVEANSQEPDKAAEGLMKRIDELTEMSRTEEQQLDLIALISQLLAKLGEENEDGEKAIPQQFFDRLKEEIGEENAKLLEQAIKDGEVIQIEKVIRRIAEEAPEQVKRFDLKPAVSREISEELEMLRSAKQNNAQKSESEITEPVKAEGEVVKAAAEVQTDGEAKSDNPGSDSNKDAALYGARTKETADAKPEETANAKPRDEVKTADFGESVKASVEARNNSTGEAKQSSEVKSESAVNVKLDGKANTADAEIGFGAVNSPIVFKTEDGAELEIKPSEVISQAMRIVERSIQDTAKQTEYSLTLNPGELGRITVRMIKAADGAVSVTIAAENAQTQRILETNSALMQNNLRSNGIQLEGWQTVSEAQQQNAAQDYNGSSKNPYYREETKPEDDEKPDVSFADIIAAM